MTLFQTIKQSITAQQAAEYYGLDIGTNGLYRCPFHYDRHPSMKVDERYYCFGCGATGDAIDLAAQMLGLSPKDAAARLAADFHIPIESGQAEITASGHDPPRTKTENRNWVGQMMTGLSRYYRLLDDWKTAYAPQDMDEEWHPLFVIALQEKDRVEYLLDELIRSDTEQLNVMKILYEKEVELIDRRLEPYVRGNTSADCEDPGIIGENREGGCQTDEGELCSGNGAGPDAFGCALLEHSDRTGGHSEGSRLVS